MRGPPTTFSVRNFSCSLWRSQPQKGLNSKASGFFSSSVDRVGVGHAGERRGDHGLESMSTRPFWMRWSKKARSSAHSERATLARRLRKSSARSMLSRDVVEGDLGLDHPELGEVARSVGVLGAESRAEGVDAAQGLAVGLDVELARDGEGGGLAEEVLGVVDRTAGLGEGLEVEGRDLEHLARALGVGGGDEGRVDVVEAALLEELVDGEGHAVADPGHRAEGIGPGPEVGDLAEELEGVGLLLEGIALGGGLADDGEASGLDLELLARGGRGDEAAFDADAGARARAGELGSRAWPRGASSKTHCILPIREPSLTSRKTADLVSRLVRTQPLYGDGAAVGRQARISP